MRKPPAAALHATPEDVETQFYDALREGNLERLMAVWSVDDEVLCIHPGGPRLVGWHAVRTAFERVFQGGAPAVHPESVRRLHTLRCAVHNVLERVSLKTAEGVRTAWVVATNVYLHTPQGWRMVAHHASPGVADKPTEWVQAGSQLH